MIGCLSTQALAFLAVFVYATHATQAIAFEWKPGFRLYKETWIKQTFARLTSSLSGGGLVGRLGGSLLGGQ